MLLPPGGEHAAEVRDIVQSDTFATEQAMGFTLNQAIKRRSAVKLAMHCNYSTNTLKLWGKLNLILISVIEISTVDEENPVLYRLIHKLTTSMDSNQVKTWY